MNGKICIPKNYEVEPCVLQKQDSIETVDQNGNSNGYVYPLVNTLIPGTLPVQLVYLTECLPRSVKGPHMHTQPKYDRFVCIKGSCIIVTRNEETGDIREEFLYRSNGYQQILLIPPYNSHAIVSKEGCTVLSICTEGYYPGHYNQIETEYKDYDWNQWLQ